MIEKDVLSCKARAFVIWAAVRVTERTLCHWSRLLDVPSFASCGVWPEICDAWNS
jgi:hypothetical protein